MFVILVYNIGRGSIKKNTGFECSQVLKLTNQSRYDEAPEKFSLWNQSNGKELKGLTLRREAEAKIFEEGIYDSSH